MTAADRNRQRALSIDRSSWNDRNGTPSRTSQAASFRTGSVAATSKLTDRPDVSVSLSAFGMGARVARSAARACSVVDSERNLTLRSQGDLGVVSTRLGLADPLELVEVELDAA